MTTEIQDVEPARADDFHASSKPYVPSYHVSKVPLSYDAQAQLAAVLRVVDPRVRSTPRLIIDATARVCQRWRILATQLSAAGWGPLGASGKKSQLPNALGCPPAFVMTAEKTGRAKLKDKKRTNCCHLRQACPFCWVREVRRYWLKIEPAFFPRIKGKKPQRVRQVDTGPIARKSSSFTHGVKDGETDVNSPYDLVYRKFAFPLPAECAAEVYGQFITINGLVAWLNSRQRGRPDPMLHRLPECRALLEAAGPSGGLLESIQCYRINGPGADQSPWEVQIHQMILAVDGDKVPKQLYPTAMPESKQHIVLRKPNHRILAKWMGKTLRYPKFFLMPDTPIDHIIEYLDARRGRRLVASYGCFRGKNPK